MLKYLVKLIKRKKHANARLFIIGNGFDRAHGFQTSYADFRDWCREILKESGYREDEVPDIPFSQIGPKGDILFDDKDRMKLLLWLLSCESVLRDDPDWNEFEDYLHELDLQMVLDEATMFVGADLENDPHDNELSHEAADMEMYASELRDCIYTIKDVFSQWIKGIYVGGDKLSFGINTILDTDGCCQERDLFFTFNYTETLEKVYGIPASQICHIHGYRHDGSALVVGHGDDTTRNFDNRIITAADMLEEAIRSLRKETDIYIRENYIFWNKLRSLNVNEVYSFGFSYGEVDLPYVQKILSCINNDEDCVWKLNSFDDKKGKNKYYESVIRACGFCGIIEKYDS